MQILNLPEDIAEDYFDNRTAFVFNVNSAGVKTDFLLSGDGAQQDDTWDAVWQARVEVGDRGWTAELALPFSQLRFGTGQPRVWGFQVRRRLHRREELSDWQFVPKDASGFVHRFGELYGLDDVPPHRQIEIVPYALSKLERYEIEEANPFSTGGGESVTGGLDGKLAATSDLTLTFTASPDFGQVEADPSEVNLTTFETFFPEKRPFFIEGSNIFDYPLMNGDGGFAQDNLFYSIAPPIPAASISDTPSAIAPTTSGPRRCSARSKATPRPFSPPRSPPAAISSGPTPTT
jgi:hypothetical protein